MIFDWDTEKAKTNQRKHGINFEEAAEVFYDPTAIERPNHYENGEERWEIIGMTTNHVLLYVVFTTIYEDGAKITRIISARKTEPKERREYELC